jgi:hypothetical protein
MLRNAPLPAMTPSGDVAPNVLSAPIVSQDVDDDDLSTDAFNDPDKDELIEVIHGQTD